MQTVSLTVTKDLIAQSPATQYLPVPMLKSNVQPQIIDVTSHAHLRHIQQRVTISIFHGLLEIQGTAYYVVNHV